MSDSPSLRILIQGAGIAGASLAALLARRGMDVTLIERSQGLRSSGNPVDVRGAAFDTAEQLGIVPALRSAATYVERFAFIDAGGRTLAHVGSRSSASDREVEIPRADLAAVLFHAIPGHVEVRFGDTIEAVQQDDAGVDVVLASSSRRFDLVIGCDGLHSTVRALAFGEDARYVQPLGLYIASVYTSQAADDATHVRIYNEPGRAVIVHPTRGQALAMFLFRAAEKVGHRDVDAQQALLQRHYSGGGWRTDELLETWRSAHDTYFDAVCRVRLPGWSRGRITLLGDAASCVSLFGNGSSLAMIGAEILADALALHPHDPATALTSYEAQHRRRVAPYLRNMAMNGRFMVPATHAGIRLRNLVMRMAKR